MVTIKNNVGSPFDVETKNGPAVLPAFGALEAEFEQGYLDLLLSCGSIQLADKAEEEAPAKPAKKPVKGKA